MSKIINSKWKNFFIKFGIILGVVVADIVCKIAFFGKDMEILPGLIGIRKVQGLNTGGAWGFLNEHLWVLIVVTIVFFIIVAAVDRKFNITHPLYLVSMSFVVGGACGNFIDRIFLGGVRDFLYFEFAPNFPTFNVADSFLCVGMGLLLIYILFIHKDEEEN
jgi:signal peptidase II